MIRHLRSLAGPESSLAQVGKGGSTSAHGAATFTRPGSYSWTVPDGVTRISIVCVGAGGGSATASNPNTIVSRGATVLCSAVSGKQTVAGNGGVKDGGGAGASGASGSGGAGGYSADGNSGAGGSGASSTWAGGGVGLWGIGPSGAVGTGQGGSGGIDGNDPSTVDGIGGDFGGGARAGGGGELSYVNDIAVTPGETLSVSVPAGQNRPGGPIETGSRISGNGGVNIVWGMGNFPALDGIAPQN